MYSQIPTTWIGRCGRFHWVAKLVVLLGRTPTWHHQILISSCNLREVNASDVMDLTPRCWKQRFADRPMRSLINPRHSDRHIHPLVRACKPCALKR